MVRSQFAGQLAECEACLHELVALLSILDKTNSRNRLWMAHSAARMRCLKRYSSVLTQQGFCQS